MTDRKASADAPWSEGLAAGHHEPGQQPETHAGASLAGASLEEQLSAWLDGQLPPAELEGLAARLGCATPESEAPRQTLARYALIGVALRERPALGALALAARVQAALGEFTEPGPQPAAIPPPLATVSTLPAPGRQVRRRWMVPAGMAAALVVAGVVLLPGLDPDTPGGVADQAAEVTLATLGSMAGEPSSLPAPPATTLSQDRLTSYLVYHGEYTGMLSNRVADSHIVAVRPMLATTADNRVPGPGDGLQ